METEPEIINRVTNSGLITLDLEEFFDSSSQRKVFDLKNHLFQEQILKEKDFRKSLKEIDWTEYEHSYVAITCSVDAIIPNWAYMLLAIYLKDKAKDYYYCNQEELEENIILSNIYKINASKYEGAKVVIKGCGSKKISSEPYVAITKILKNYVSTLMYGEPCSTVPLYKNRDLKKN